MSELKSVKLQEHLKVLRSTSARLQELVEPHEVAVLQRRPFAGKWTPCEILGHFVDHEIVTASRIRTTRLSGMAWLDRYPQEAWVAGQNHASGDPPTFARRFAQLRDLNLEQYDVLSDADWTRSVPRRDEEGEYSLLQLVRRHAEHDLHHLAQFKRYVKGATG